MTKGENPKTAPATVRAQKFRTNWAANANAATPDTTGANKLATLDEAIGPKSSVMGDNTNAGNIQLVLDIALMPPNRAKSASE
jgi:hypothetical protein